MDLLAPPLDSSSLRGVDVLRLATVARRLRVPEALVLRFVACGSLGAVRVDGTLLIPAAALRAYENEAAAHDQREAWTA